MALNQAQLLSGDSSKGTVLSGLVQGVKAGTGIAIAADGTISINNATLTSVVKLNNPSAYNAYVWPTGAGAADTFLKTDNAGNLSWETTGATVTVQSQPAPTGATEGDLWFDCTEGAIKIYQSCIAPAGWTQLGQVGYPAEASNTSSPDITSGGGSASNPYILPAFEVPSGESVLLPYTITVINVAPGQFIPIVDVNNSINESRFDVNNRYADNGGVLTFQPIFTDLPPSPQGTSFTALARIGNPGSGSSVYVQLPINITNPLFIQPGAISGNPAEGETLVYTQGAINGGQAPYIKAQAWLKNGVYIPGETGTSYDVTAADNGSVITVEYTVVDQNGYRTSAITAPVGPIGAIALPSNTSSNPAFVVGDGTITNPFQLTSINVGAGTSSLFPQVITITGLDPQEFIPIVDRNVDVNGGRFTFTNSYANGAGDLIFQVRFSDTPESTEGSGYTALIQAGSNSVYFEGTAGVNQALTVSPGYISGNPTVNSTLTYNVGTAAGGVSPYIYSYQWLRNENPISGATGTTYTATSADLGTNLTVKITVRDNQNTTATALSAAFGPISTAAFPDTSWDPLPSNGMETIPGGESGEYNGTGSVITTTGCIEASVNGGAYSIGSQACVSGDILAIRWNTGASCGGAASGTTITGSITDGAYTNDYSITIDRVPNSLPNISTTDVNLGSTQTKTVPQTITGINAPAYVTYSSASTGLLIKASKDGGSKYTTLATSGKGFSVNIGDTLIIRQTVGSTISTTYDAIIRVGDGTNTVGTYDEFTFSSTTTEDTAWPNLPQALVDGPQAIPDTVSATWVDGNGTVSASGCIEVSNNNSTWGTSAAVTAGVTTLYVRWKGAYNGGGASDGNCGQAAEGTKITGRIYGGSFYQDYELLLKKIPTGFIIPANTGQPVNYVVTSEVLTWANTNAPANIWAMNTSTLTNIQVSFDGGPWTDLEANTGNPTQYVNPNSTIQFRGTTGSGNSTTYTMNLQVRDQQGGGQDYTWNVTTLAATPSIATPTIVTPTNGATNLNPANNTPPGITITGSDYTPEGGAGSQTGSTWEVYGGGIPLISTNTITNVDSNVAGDVNLDPTPEVEPPSGTSGTGIAKLWYNPNHPSNPNTYMIAGSIDDNIMGANYIYRIPNVATDNYNSYPSLLSNNVRSLSNETAHAVDVKSVGNNVLISYYVYNYSVPTDSFWIVKSYSADLSSPGTIPDLKVQGDFTGIDSGQYRMMNILLVGDKIIVNYSLSTYPGVNISTPPAASYIYRFDPATDTEWQTLHGWNTGVVGDDTVWGTPMTGGGLDENNAPLYLYVKTNEGAANGPATQVVVSYDAGDTWVDANVGSNLCPYQAWSNSTSTIVTMTNVLGDTQVDGLYYYPSYWTNDRGANWTLITVDDLPGYVSPGNGVYNSPTLYEDTFIITSQMSSFRVLPYFATTNPAVPWAKTDITFVNQGAYEWETVLQANGYGYFVSDTNKSSDFPPDWQTYPFNRSYRYAVLVSNPGVTTNTLTISGVEQDGFKASMGIVSVPSGGSGVIYSTSPNQIVTSGSGWSVGPRIQTDPATYGELPNSPYSGQSGNLTSTFVSQDDLAKNETYYARVQYSTANAPAAFSDYSSWSTFSTSTDWTPTPGTEMEGGYFGGQYVIDNTLYNLILSPTKTGRLAQKTGAYTSTLSYNFDKTYFAYDGLQSTVFQATASTPYTLAQWMYSDSSGPNAGVFSYNQNGTGINGYNDWYIPSLYEMICLYYYLKPTSTNNSLGTVTNSLYYDGINPYAVSPPYNERWTQQDPGKNPLLSSPSPDALSTGSAYWTTLTYSQFEQYVWYNTTGYAMRSASAQSEDPQVIYNAVRAMRRSIA
jgi:hypothetical protein